ncbi:hypothetical protein E1B28_009890 [Marasmius oreades]|uniref:GYF domain-containing protein n=1 Tax=Marasmius oreades TaxID=181124 RepID=A0A9P7RVZ4_9AGAR|nr:uncharacterized protein E1B28_009890 [Marasmius oreades]KAG7090806.1 hypothetical protein E1B28_009890 [Marasmius oreades]
MSTTTMHFGPEWMRPKQQSVSRTQPPLPPSPPPAAIPQTPNASSYSALVSPAPPIQPQKQDEAHPFRYSKEEMLRIYKESNKGGLGLEVERWEGVVREIGTDPIGLREMGENEKKLFATSLNSDLRRRQSNDYLNLNTQNLERPRLVHSGTGSSTGSPLRERYGSMSMLQRRRDSTDQAPNITPRKLSLSSQAPLGSPRDIGLPSPRRLGHTPSFDGVLNGGESWIARRRTSEGLSKTAGITRETSGDENEIREEEEEIRVEEKPDPRDSSTLPNEADQPANASGIALQRPQDIENRFSQLSLDQKTPDLLNSPNPPPTSAPPQPTDLAGVDWSYLDPQGQVQGPFRADLMQKWNDAGYFTFDLHMKRNNIDTDWMTVAELARRTGGGKMFLSPIAPPMPPGLTRHTESPFGLAAEQNLFNDSPFQPSPIRSIRSSTLDSYIGTGSNPSDSPASSFGGGRFGDGSPDPVAFGGRVGQYGAGDIGVSRVGGFGMTGDSSPALPGRRTTFVDSVDFRSAGYNNMLPPRGSTVDNGFGMNGSSGFTSPWGSGNFDGLSGNGRSSADSSGYQAAFGNNAGLVLNASSLGSSSFSDLPANTAPYRVSDFGYGTPSVNQQDLHSQDKMLGGYNRSLAGAPLYGDPSSQTIPVSAVPQYNVNPNQTQQQHIPTSIPDLFDQNQTRQLPNQFSDSDSIVSASPWGAVDSPVNKRPGPFDPPHSISTNTAANALTQNSPWETAHQTHQTLGPVSQVSEPPQSSQTREEQELVGTSPSSFLQREEAIAQAVETSTSPQDVITIPPSPPLPKTQLSPQPPTTTVEEVPSPAPVPSEQMPSSLKVKIKSTLGQQSATVSRSPVEPIAMAPPQAQTSPQPQTVGMTSKAPWAKDDDAKKLSTATSLRQIQDAEAKKVEARKVAEREREKERATAISRGNPTTSATGTAGNEDLQGFTTSWGLPTSKAGRGGSGSSIASPSKETISTPSPAPAVWTGAAKATPAKKSMKEIQEEEERRKKVSAAKEIGGGSGVSVGGGGPRRGYADSTSKSTPTIVQGNAWTTVGPSGKTFGPAPRPVPPPSAASSSSVPRINGASTTIATATTRPAPPANSKPLASAASKVEDFPLPPSNDFMRWLGDNMKGLNSSVNVEEIMSMLLSFPLDPDPSTTEIISDLIYANSTTLDGRRFAADFVGKRKADAMTRSKGTGGAGAKPISIADVVKAQPKQQTSEWGGFKVVNKKKKGGRS